MANQKDQKRKLLAIQKILLEKSDAEHPITLAQITEELAAQDIEAERKSIYNCIDALRDSGMDIIMKNNPRPAYYLASRQFSSTELQLLADVVQSSPLISTRKVEPLIRKIGQYASEKQRNDLVRCIQVPERTRKASKYIFENLGMIQSAIQRKKQITFKYFGIGIDGKHVFHKRSGKTIVSFKQGDKVIGGPKEGRDLITLTPVRLVYMSDHYYVVCWDPDAPYAESGDFRTFRVDRMGRVMRADNKPAIRNERIATYDPKQWEDRAFGMFYNQEGRVSITMLVEDASATERGYSWIMGAFYDKFGESMDVRKLSDTSARIFFKTVASPQFFSWLLQFGGAVKIEKPSKVAKEYIEGYLQPALARYE